MLQGFQETSYTSNLNIFKSTVFLILKKYIYFLEMEFSKMADEKSFLSKEYTIKISVQIKQRIFIYQFEWNFLALIKCVYFTLWDIRVWYRVLISKYENIRARCRGPSVYSFFSKQIPATLTRNLSILNNISGLVSNRIDTIIKI